MPIAVSVAAHSRSGLRSPFAAKAMMRFAMVSLMIFRLTAIVENGDCFVKRHAQHRNRVGIKNDVRRDESKNVTHDAPPLARSA